MNGEESEVKKIVASMKEDEPKEEVPPVTGSKARKQKDYKETDGESDVTQYSSEDERTEKPVVEAEKPRRRSTRVRKKDRDDD